MDRKPRLKLDVIGYWSEVKLEIVKEYATAYSTILSAQKGLYHIYIDAFAGAGAHISKETGNFVKGSPLNALAVQPPFREFHFIDIQRAKVDELKKAVIGKPNVLVHEGDCNDILLEKIFPKVQWRDFRRGLCLLDPYGLHLNWEVIETAGKMRTIDMFLNFPVADMNRNVFWRNPEGVAPSDIERMNAFWGDESWKEIVYSTERNLFGWEEKTADNEDIAEAFMERLKKVAGFGYVPKPMPMRNSQGAIVYYLFFASRKKVASDIIGEIFDKYRKGA